ncbi:unnamed protein product [Lathyrus sativus]|nr:unnamed protein product [Lathyrus sativus]
MSADSEKLTIFRYYIHEIPPKHEIPFDNFRHIDIILSFASEKGDGRFHPTWIVDRFGIEWLKRFKQEHPNARVVISIGGVGSEFPFNPAQKDGWICNAIETIKNIILLFKDIIDGIDIHYDVIKSSEDDFSFCIGQVIKQLKNNIDSFIKVVSIAPTELVEPYYLKLYKDNKDIIDLVDYQFYNQKFSSKEEILELYKKLVTDYYPAKVLVGISIPVDPILHAAICYLVYQKLLPGIFVWNMFDSIDSPNNFSLEKILKDLINL